MKAIHIKIEEAGAGNPPYIRDDSGHGVRLWSHQGVAFEMDKSKDGYLVFVTDAEFWAEVFREAGASGLDNK